MSAAADGVTPAGIAGVVLAAGEGRRLRPLTFERPKPLCPVGNVALVDRALAAVRSAVPTVAVNVHHGRAAMIDHLEAQDDPSLHVSVEDERPLGTAGALGYLRPWLAGRAALIVNADAFAIPDLVGFLAGWDHERVRILVAGHEPFGPRSRIVASLMPWSALKALAAEPSGLYERSWRARAEEHAVETCAYDGPFVDCGTPSSYLTANLLAVAADEKGSIVARDARVDATAAIVGSVVGSGAEVAGTVRSSVIWPGATVAAGEGLDRAIRTPRGRTVLVR